MALGAPLPMGVGFSGMFVFDQFSVFDLSVPCAWLPDCIPI